MSTLMRSGPDPFIYNLQDSPPTTVNLEDKKRIKGIQKAHAVAGCMVGFLMYGPYVRRYTRTRRNVCGNVVVFVVWAVV